MGQLLDSIPYSAEIFKITTRVANDQIQIGDSHEAPASLSQRLRAFWSANLELTL